MTTYTIYQIDAFTNSRFKGNPAGVVLNADGLSEDEMQDIARELNNSETAFLFQPDDNTCDGVIRYFTPLTEVPTCGHATIAAMYAKAVEEGLESITLNMKTKIGILPFEIIRSENHIKIRMTQGDISIDPPLSNDIRNQLIQYLGLTYQDLDPGCPVQIVSTGHSKVMIGIKSREMLNRMRPDMAGLTALSREINCNGYFVFTLNSQMPGILSCGRMFAPAIGIHEDPVTGNANGPLGAYLIHHQLVDTRNHQFCFKGLQGEAMGREGVIEVLVSIKDGQPSLVKIAGEAVPVFKTSIDL